MKKAIRTEYAEKGVEKYYQTQANSYENPHVEYVKTLLEQNQHRLDYSKTLDLACGGGEVTLILRGLGFDNTTGCDPFTGRLFEKNVGTKCLKYSFDDIVSGKFSVKTQNPETLKSNQSVMFSTIICSFAMHLCAEKQLFPLVARLFLLTETIVIITPHKRPELEKLANARLLFADFTLTERGKKVFLKAYGGV